jgi:hypothetical protein
MTQALRRRGFGTASAATRRNFEWTKTLESAIAHEGRHGETARVPHVRESTTQEATTNIPRNAPHGQRDRETLLTTHTNETTTTTTKNRHEPSFITNTKTQGNDDVPALHTRATRGPTATL